MAYLQKHNPTITNSRNALRSIAAAEKSALRAYCQEPTHAKRQLRLRLYEAKQALKLSLNCLREAHKIQKEIR